MRIERIRLHAVGPFDDLDLWLDRGSSGTETHVFAGMSGSGKTVLLHAVGRLFGETQLASYMHDSRSYVLIEAGGRVYGIAREATALISPFTGLHECEKRTELAFSDPLDKLICRSALVECAAPRAQPLPAFAYTGGSTPSFNQIMSVEELKDHPLKIPVSFAQMTDASALVQWIANTKTKETLALVRGDIAAAERHVRGLKEVEHLIGQVIGEKIHFVLHDTLEVRVFLRGRDMALSILPAGFRALISWTMDLLRRMSRLYQGENPLEKPFLLLLDDVDLHMHPRWQRRLLHVLRESFPRAQIFITTNSPFVINEDENVCFYHLRDGEVIGISSLGQSHETILDEAFGLKEEYAPEV